MSWRENHERWTNHDRDVDKNFHLSYTYKRSFRMIHPVPFGFLVYSELSILQHAVLQDRPLLRRCGLRRRLLSSCKSIHNILLLCKLGFTLVLKSYNSPAQPSPPSPPPSPPSPLMMTSLASWALLSAASSARPGNRPRRTAMLHPRFSSGNFRISFPKSTQ